MLQLSIDSLKTKLSVDVPIPKDTLDDPPRNEDVVAGEVPDTTIASDNPPLKNDATKYFHASTPTSDDPNLYEEEDHFE